MRCHLDFGVSLSCLLGAQTRSLNEPVVAYFTSRVTMRKNVLSLRMTHARAALSTAVAPLAPRCAHRQRMMLASTTGHIHLASKAGAIPPANPPPTSERSLGLQRLYAQHRPLLEHEQLPARSLRIMEGDTLMMESEPLVVPERSVWRRRARRIDTDTFANLLDHLSQLRVSSPSVTTPRKSRIARRTRARGAVASLLPSPAVVAASQRIERMERDAEEREQVMANAREHGLDLERASRLGAEAELVVLGEPAGPHKDWAPGVATHLGSHTQAYVPPAARHVARRRIRARSMDAIDTADEDAHLWLTHGLVQTRVKADHDWRAFVATTMEAPPVSSHPTVSLDSVRRKRRKKMNKHKYKKLRKRQRAERQRLKK